MSRPKSSAEAASTAPRGDRAEHLTVKVSGTLTLDRIFTRTEERLVEKLIVFAEAGAGEQGRDLKRTLDSGMQTLGSLALSLESYPSLKGSHRLGSKERSLKTLMGALVEGGEHGVEWILPSKAVLARAYGIAKVNFLTALRYAVEPCEGQEAQQLTRRINEAIEEAVYTRLAEELYASFITSLTMKREVKVLAAQQLVDMWEGRVHVVTDRFCPLLRSAWVARTRAPRVFGTLLGTSEIVQLLFRDCEEAFVTFFGRHEQDSEQRQAFEEFLFDLAFEDLEKVRQRMKEEGKTAVGPREVERYLGFGQGKLRPLVGDPKALYVSFRRRRVKAQYRTSMRVPGPKRTAEAYILEALLLEETGRSER
ncbi:MAG: hypothetical protein ACYTG6_05160 [Planctomycetota bacterium]|jgi:hypothetical protein